MRINKFLSEANFCSRRQADKLIGLGRVKINGRVAGLGDQVQEGDRVLVDGKEIQRDKQKKIYLLYHKPAGVIVTTNESSPDNIIKKINYPERVYPIGRLDVNTSGLILLTNDGSVVNKILKGENKVEKEYEVRVDKTLTEEFIQKVRKGFVLKKEEYPTLPAKVSVLGEKIFRTTIVEGKKRQIRRMCKQLGYEVEKLKRIRIGQLSLDRIKLALGEYIPISENQINKLIKRKE
jgi:23S rRNA pseudouridine2604 synthase